MNSVFARTVLCWFDKNKRQFPWRKTVNAYHVFIAEILLRRTQAERVVQTYEKLVTKYPTIESLSRADVQEIRTFFQVLGLNKRADLLVEAARKIVREHGGQIPRNLGAIAALPGMGTYSSRAVACLAFGEPVPMIDESAGRLLRRLLNLKGSGPAYSDKQLMKQTAEIIPSQNAREFNLGVLDIAAAFCHSKIPDCPNCPLREVCCYCKLN